MARRNALAVLAAAGVVAGTLAVAPARAQVTERVIVQAASVTVAAEAVHRAGGTVERELALIDGVAATVPVGAVLAGVDAVTPNRQVVTAATDSGGAGTATNAYRQETQATEVGSPSRAVAVAVIDTGISPVGGLADNLLSVPDPKNPGRTAPCANFSSESTCDDTYGHGTFLAGLIAGDGAYPGMDPSARLVSVKIAGRNGSADTSQLLAALQYVVSFRDHLGIGVLNLSLGTDSNHDARKDPLNRAVERAWQAGITVVVAASNRGHAGTAGTISKPADDPLVITVGAVDDLGTGTRGDDRVPAFTAQGPVVQGPAGDRLVVAKPDVVAPGVSLVSLVAPGSHIEQTAPPSTVGVAGYRRGSGTSQAAAVVSGAAALLLERRDWTPDEVKAALVRGAFRLDAPSSVVGAGVISVAAALGQSASGAAQPLPRQDPFDGLDASREHSLVTSFACGPVRAAVDGDDCTYVHGRLTALGVQSPHGAELLPFDGPEYATDPWTGQSWYGSQWLAGQSWYGQSWYGQSWYGQSWYETSSSPPPSGGTATDFGTVLPGSAWYGAWR
ncbi:MAG TPA: S8 family serine peptidase [Mycobacteriales bacterium]|nr:S8 family serine peptidase [Mycobacteriales bacterium]